jgi:NADH oxidase (H2O-forming)
MAEHIAEGIRETDPGIKVETADIETMPLGEIDSLLTRCKALLVGSPTINQNTLLPVYKMFALINPIRDKGKLAASFGSYGWSGEAVSIIEDNLKNLKLKVVEGGFSSKFYPHAEKIEELKAFGRKFGNMMTETAN